MNKVRVINERMIWGIKFAVICILLLRFVQVSVCNSIPTALQDPLGSFDFQWDGAKLLADGQNLYRESLDRGLYEDGERYSQWYGPMDTNYFPSMFCLLLPLTVFDPIDVKTIWLVLNFVFLFATAYFLRKTVLKDEKVEDAMIWCLLLMCSQPVENCIANGQHLLFSTAFFMASVYVCEQESKKNIMVIMGGLLLGYSYFKFTVIFPMALFFIYKKWYKQVVVSVVMHTVLTIWSAVRLRENILNMFILPVKISANLQSQGFVDLGVFVKNNIIYFALVAIIVLILFAIVFCKGKTDDWEVMSLLIISALILAYHRKYDFFVMIIPFYYFYKNRTKYGKKICNLRTFVSIVAVVCCWLIFFNDTIINKLGISFTSGNGEYIYTIICAIGMYMMELYLLGDIISTLLRDRRSVVKEYIK